MLDAEMPIFNLQAVVRETGVKPDTLRAWERRYGLPQPERTEGGHRLYSRKDIKTIKWLLAQREAGLGISKAVELWRQLEASRDAQLSQVDASGSEAPAGTEAEHDNLGTLRRQWISASLVFNENGARAALSEAFALFSVERVCFELIMAGLAEIGEGWYKGEVTVQQEHFATSLATRQLESLIAASPPPTQSGRILAACPPEENHVLALLLLTLLLRRRGREVVYLGANVPIDHITDTIRNGDFQIVVTSAQQLHTAASLKNMATEISRIGVPVVYGGRIFNMIPELRDRIPGTFLGERLELAPQVVENVMVAQPEPIPVQPTPEELLIARDRFQHHLPAIESTVEEELADSGITHLQITRANRTMDLDISSALVLGDMSFLGNEISWVNGLLRNHDVPAELLNRYLLAYKEALSQHLLDNGAREGNEPILDWLDKAV